MFKKDDVYTVDGDAVRWVGVVIAVDFEGSGSVRAIETAYSKHTGQFVGVDAVAYFHNDRPGQRVLLTDPMKSALLEAERVLPKA